MSEPFGETSQSTERCLEIEGLIPGVDSEVVFAAFVEPERLVTWWPQEADVDPSVGGSLELRWPDMGWTLRGVFTGFDPGRSLAFTWAWDHEPDTPRRTVEVTLSAVDDGTRITLSHGDYGDDDSEERAGHLDGWVSFLGRLAESLSG